MPLRCWKVDTRAAALGELLSWCLLRRRVDRMLFILPASPGRWRYKGRAERDRAQAVIDRTNLLFGRHIIDRLPVTAWPGTELVGGVASALVLEFNEAVKENVLKAGPELNKWLHHAPHPLPEDICLFKAETQHPSFVSITHEGRAWLIGDSDPQLRGVTSSKDRAEGLFFEGDYFCRPYKS